MAYYAETLELWELVKVDLSFVSRIEIMSFTGKTGTSFVYF